MKHQGITESDRSVNIICCFYLCHYEIGPGITVTTHYCTVGVISEAWEIEAVCDTIQSDCPLQLSHLFVVGLVVSEDHKVVQKKN